MPRAGRKHRNEEPLNLGGERGGMNIALPRTQLPRGDFARVFNFYHDLRSGRLTTRPGLTKYTTGAGTGYPVNGIYNYIKTSSLSYVMCCSNGKLYYLDGSKAFVEVGDLKGLGRPSLTTFNTKLTAASGGKLQTWDGTTLADLANSPTVSTMVISDEASKRLVVAGDTTNYDRVSCSKAGDETVWATPDGKYFDVGFRDGSLVSGLAPFLMQLVVFKASDSKRATFRVEIGITSSDGDVLLLNSFNAVVNHHLLSGSLNDLCFLDQNGFKRLVGTSAYGDLAVRSTGGEIDDLLRAGVDPFSFMYTRQAQIWIVPDTNIGTVYVWHWARGGWAEYKFTGLKPCSGAYLVDDDILLLGMDDGHIYKLDTAVALDNGEAYPSLLEWPTLLPWGNVFETVIKGPEELVYEALSVSGGGAFGIKSGFGTVTQALKGFSLEAPGDYLINATGDLIDATQELAVASVLKKARANVNVAVDNVQPYLSLTSGRIALEAFSMNLARGAKV